MWLARYTLLLLLLAPAVGAYSIDEVWFETNGVRVSEASPGGSITADLVMRLSSDFAQCVEEDVCSMLLNSGELPLSDARIEVKSCPQTNGTYTCRLGPISTVASESYTFTYYTQVGGERILDQTATFGLTLTTPAQAGYSATSGELTWEGSPVETIGVNARLPGTILHVGLADKFTDCPQCVVTFSGIGTVTAGDCPNVNGSITCMLPSFTFTADQTSFSYTVETPTLRDDQPQTLDVSVSVDDTIPVVSSIETGYCVEGTCWVSGTGATPYTITFDDAQASFDMKLVFVGTEHHASQVQECTGNTCTGEVRLFCADGEQLTLDVRSVAGVSSREDSQNEIQSSGGTPVTCSDQPPEILEWTEEADGLVGLAVEGSTVTFTARVRTAVGEPTSTVDAKGMVNGSVDAVCTAVGEEFECVWQFVGVNAGTFALDFEILDPIGNSVVRPTEITVLQLKTLPDNATTSFFTVQTGAVSPEHLNRLALDLASANFLPYPVYIEYSLLNTAGADVEIVQQDLVSCEYKLPWETNFTTEYNLLALGAAEGARPETHLLYPNADWDEPNRIDGQVRASRDVLALSDEFATRCHLDLYVREGNALYASPETEQIEFTLGFRETALGEPGANFVQKINDTEKKLTGSTAKKIRKLEKYRQQADKICRGVETYVTIHNTAAILITAGEALCPAFGLGEGIKKVASPIFGTMDAFMEPAWNGMLPWGGPVAQAVNRIKKATEVAAMVGVIPNNNALLETGGPLKILCRQVNCRVTAELNSAAFDTKKQQAKRVENAREGLEDTQQKLDGGDISQAEANARTAHFNTVIETGGVAQGADGTYEQLTQAGAGQAPPSPSLNDWKQDPKQAGRDLIASANVQDPEQSLTASLFTACLGGVVYNLQKYQAVDCGYLQCLKEQSTRGHSISICEEARDYQTCNHIVGEVASIPGINILDNLMGYINHIIATLPNALAKYFLNEYCTNRFCFGGAPPETLERGRCFNPECTACAVAGTAINTIDAAEQTKQAYGGIRNVEAAEAALRICDAALEDQPLVDEYEADFFDRIVFEQSAFTSAVYAKSTPTENGQFVASMDMSYREANPYAELPAGYKVSDLAETIVGEEQFTRYEVIPLDVAGEPIPNTKKIWLQEWNGNNLLGQPVTEHRMVFEVEQGSLYQQAKKTISKSADASKAAARGGLASLFKGLLFGQQPDVEQVADAAKQAGADAAKDGVKDVDLDEETQTREWSFVVPEELPGWGSIGDAESRNEFLGDYAVWVASRSGIQFQNKDELDTWVLYDAYLGSGDQLAQYEEARAIVDSWEAEERALLGELETLRDEHARLEGLVQEDAAEKLKIEAEIAEVKGRLSKAKADHAKQSREIKKLADEFKDGVPDDRLTSDPLYIADEEFQAAAVALDKTLEELEVAALSAEDMLIHWTSEELTQTIALVEASDDYGVILAPHIGFEYTGDKEKLLRILREAQTMVLLNEKVVELSGTTPTPWRNELETARDSYNNADLALRQANDDLAEERAELEELRKNPSATQEEIDTQAERVRKKELELEQKEKHRDRAFSEMQRIETMPYLGDFLSATRELDAVLANEDLGLVQREAALNELLQQEGVAEYMIVSAQKDYERCMDINSGVGILCSEETLALEDAQARAPNSNVLANYEANQAKILDLVYERDSIWVLCDPQCTDQQELEIDELNEQIEAIEQLLEPEGAALDVVRQRGEDIQDSDQARRDLELYMQAMSVYADYVLKWALDADALDFLKLTTWSSSIADFLNELSVEKQLRSQICEGDIITEGGDGAIYQPSAAGVPTVLATFASEIRHIQNETSGSYNYITIAHVQSPSEHRMEIVFTDLEECLDATCENEYSLTNDAFLTIKENEPFSNGGIPRTRIEYLPGKYGKVCLKFSTDYPVEGGKREYCRDIKEDAFDRDADVVGPPATTPGEDAPEEDDGPDPEEGWE